MPISRRKFLGAGAATIAVPTAIGAVITANRASATNPTLSIDLQNNTGSNTVYAYVTGQAIDHGGAWFLLQADGQTPYYPSSPSSTGSPLGADCAIVLNASGAGARRVTIPRLAGARLWFSIGAKLTFLLNPGPALVEPSVSNSADPNINVLWDFCEFTYNATELYANISAVDFFSIPVALEAHQRLRRHPKPSRASPPAPWTPSAPRSARRPTPTAKAGTSSSSPRAAKTFEP